MDKELEVEEYNEEHNNEHINEENSSNENNLQMDAESVENKIDETIENNETSDLSSRPTVKRLSLFDTVEKEIRDSSKHKEERTEPVISENNEEDRSINESDSEQKLDEEFNAEENELDEEFNQETEEELLDIPTFLRRQAN